MSSRAEIGGKRCSNCFAWKPVADFYPKLDGYQARCKACNAEVVASWKERYPDSYIAVRRRTEARKKARRELARSFA